MKLSFRTRLLAAASITLATGLIGCQLHRSHHKPERVRGNYTVPNEPAPLHREQLPLGNPHLPVLTPPSQVPPPEDESESPVPTAGLTPIQRTGFFSKSNSCPTCPSACDTCKPSFADRCRMKMEKDRCKMSSMMSSFNLFSKKSGCKTCSPCQNSCNSCYSGGGGIIADGYVVGDMGYPGTAWTPTPYDQFSYAPQMPVAYQSMPSVQPPCNCQQNQTMMAPQYSYAPQYYPVQQYSYVPQYQPVYQPTYPQTYSVPQPHYQPQYQVPVQPGYAPQTYPTPAQPAPQVRVPQGPAPVYTAPTPVAPQVPGAS